MLTCDTQHVYVTQRVLTQQNKGARTHACYNWPYGGGGGGGGGDDTIDQLL